MNERDDEELYDDIADFTGASFGDAPIRLDRDPPRPARDRK